MKSLDILIVTFNCGRAMIDVDHLVTHLFSRKKPPSSFPDLIVLALQEVAPVAQSFLGGSLLVPYLVRFSEALQKCAGHAEHYDHVATRNVGMTAIMLFCKEATKSKINAIQSAEVGLGFLQMGNKGAVALRVAIGDTTATEAVELTFVAAHLAPMEDRWQQRNLEWQQMVQSLAFISRKSLTTRSSDDDFTEASEADSLLTSHSNKAAEKHTGIFSSRAPVFVAGDLNYRTSNASPSPNDHLAFPQPKEFRHKTAHDPHDEGNFARLKAHDQLDRERAAGHVAVGLDELPIRFPPTYKYLAKSSMNSSSMHAEDEPEWWAWAKHRFPSWCDRVLFSAGLLSGTPPPLRAYEYRALPLQPTSDHRPVAMHFSIDISTLITRKSPLASVLMPVPLDVSAIQRRAYIRKLEIFVGILAYLTMTVNGNVVLIALVLGAAGGWLAARSLSIPST